MLRLSVTHRQKEIFEEVLSLHRREDVRKQSRFLSPIRNTGMKAPQGTGMVVATADIQN